jgi:hypothetical protein
VVLISIVILGSESCGIHDHILLSHDSFVSYICMYMNICMHVRSRSSDGLDGRGSVSSRVKGFFSTPRHPDRPWGPPGQLSNGYQSSFRVNKRPGHEADHLPPSNVAVKNGGAIHPLTMRFYVALTRKIQGDVAGNKFDSTRFFDHEFLNKVCCSFSYYA